MITSCEEFLVNNVCNQILVNFVWLTHLRTCILVHTNDRWLRPSRKDSREGQSKPVEEEQGDWSTKRLVVEG